MIDLTGTRPLLRVTVRQDGRNIAPWVGAITVLSASSILAYTWIFPDPADRRELATAIGANPALAFIFGPARDLATADGFNAWRAGMLGAFFAGLMAILIVVRNSRADEDSGRAELLASGVLARPSRLAVAVLLASIASVALGVVSFVITVICGGGTTDTLILSATYVASGLMFAGVAAIAAQLGSDARTASSLAVGTLGVCYVARGYIDTSDAPTWTTWLTPFGWLEKTEPSIGNDPLPLLLAVGFAATLTAIAFALQARRDFASGVIAPRPGRAEAGSVGNIWGFALRLHRGTLIVWLIAFAGLGLIFGNLATSIGDIIAGNPLMADILASGAVAESDFTFAFLATILQLLGIIAAVMGAQIALRIHSEEIDYRVEPLLAGSLRRSTYLASNAVVALVGTALVMFVAGIGLGVIASASDDTVSVGDAIEQSMVTVPAVWTLVALGLAAVGALPRARLVVWVGIVASFGLTILGPTFKLPEWMLGISPLHHVPNVNSASPDWTGLYWVSAITIVLLCVAFVGFDRRDIHRV